MIYWIPAVLVYSYWWVNVPDPGFEQWPNSSEPGLWIRFLQLRVDHNHDRSVIAQMHTYISKG